MYSVVHLILNFQKFNLDHLGLFLNFYPGYQQLLKPKISLALKVLEVFPGKITA